jgi:hypothetical protein
LIHGSDMQIIGMACILDADGKTRLYVFGFHMLNPNNV